MSTPKKCKKCGKEQKKPEAYRAIIENKKVYYLCQACITEAKSNEINDIK